MNRLAKYVMVLAAGVAGFAVYYAANSRPEKFDREPETKRDLPPTPKEEPRETIEAVKEDPAADAGKESPRPLSAGEDKEEKNPIKTIRELDWKSLGKVYLAMMQNKFEDLKAKDSAKMMRASATMMELFADLKDHPELREEVAVAYMTEYTDGIASALGIELTEDQKRMLEEYYGAQNPDDLLGYPEGIENWYEQNPLDSLKSSLKQSALMSDAFSQILRPDQTGAFKENYPTDPLWAMFQKEIPSSSPQDAIDRLASHWMNQYGANSELRPQVLSLAQSYYDQYQRLHTNYAGADLSGRSDIWSSTIDAQMKLVSQIEELTGKKGPGVMSMEAYQVITFPK